MVGRPVDEVFDFMADLDKLPLWLDGCRKAWSPDGEARSVGARVVHEDQFMGRTFEAHFTVAEWEENKRMVFEATAGPFRGLSEEEFFDEGADTRVVIRVTGEPAGFLKAMGLMAGRMAKTQLERSLDNLQRVLEETG